MAGFGAQPMGTSPFGVGTPTSATEPPDGPAGSRYLNPVTRDYEIDDTTRQFKQMPPTRQRVLLAVMTDLGSSALPRFGVKRPPRMGETFEREQANAVRRALRHMTDVEKVLSIDSIKVERGLGGRARTTIAYTDLLADTADRLTV